ncbi:MAG: hypothetical protein M3256_19855, partial [Actinomycetota bacterium]|nr:hypothetical protein [Actinomycetota bacterium]
VQVDWKDTTGNTLRTDKVNLPTLTTTWQQATANVTAPAGTTYANIAVTGATGTTGNYLYLDDLLVG